MSTHDGDALVFGVFDELDALVIGFDRSGQVLNANRRACDRLGYTTAQMTTQRAPRLVAAAQADRFARALHDVCAGTAVGILRTQLLRSGGALIDVEGPMVLLGEPGGPKVVVGIFVEREPTVTGPFTVPLHGEVLLTPRQRSVLQLFAQGYTTPQVAAELGIAVKTVHNHLTAIYRSLRARSLVQATLIAARLGIVQLENPSSP
jgi:PAS domain S-box-containing protein